MLFRSRLRHNLNLVERRTGRSPCGIDSDSECRPSDSRAPASQVSQFFMLIVRSTSSWQLYLQRYTNNVMGWDLTSCFSVFRKYVMESCPCVLATFLEYMQPLREEVEEVVKSEGWTKAGLDQMHKNLQRIFPNLAIDSEPA